MPLYSYECEDCHAECELLVRGSDTPVARPAAARSCSSGSPRICVEIKYPAIAKSWRKAAAAEGELSNFSKQEIQAKPKG